MLSIEEFKKTLPDKYKDLPEEKITKLRDDLDKFANLFFDRWLRKKNEKKENTTTTRGDNTSSNTARRDIKTDTQQIG
jgi:hypothetical protein